MGIYDALRYSDNASNQIHLPSFAANLKSIILAFILLKIAKTRSLSDISG